MFFVGFDVDYLYFLKIHQDSPSEIQEVIINMIHKYTKSCRVGAMKVKPSPLGWNTTALPQAPPWRWALALWKATSLHVFQFLLWRYHVQYIPYFLWVMASNDDSSLYIVGFQRSNGQRVSKVWSLGLFGSGAQGQDYCCNLIGPCFGSVHVMYHLIMKHNILKYDTWYHQRFNQLGESMESPYEYFLSDLMHQLVEHSTVSLYFNSIYYNF